MISKNIISKDTLDRIDKLSKEAKDFSESIYTTMIPVLNEYNTIIENYFGPLYDNLYKTLGETLKMVEPIIKQIEEDQKLTKEELINKYKSRIENNTLLGKNGWVTSPHTNQEILQKWINSIKQKDESVIINFFDGNSGIINEIMQSLRKDYCQCDNKAYFEKAYSFFYSGDYFSCSFYLLALLDERINKTLDFGDKRKYKNKYTFKGIDPQINKEFLTKNSSISRKYFFVLDIYPSLCSFLYRLYVDGDYNFENGIEPPYLNRNWIMHGRSRRIITKTDCIQLLNALESIEFINKFTLE